MATCFCFCSSPFVATGLETGNARSFRARGLARDRSWSRMHGLIPVNRFLSLSCGQAWYLVWATDPDEALLWHGRPECDSGLSRGTRPTPTRIHVFFPAEVKVICPWLALSQVRLGMVIYLGFEANPPYSLVEDWQTQRRKTSAVLARTWEEQGHPLPPPHRHLQAGVFLPSQPLAWPGPHLPLLSYSYSQRAHIHKRR